LENLLKKQRETGTTDRKKWSGRPRCARTEDNVSSVEELVLSQEGQPQMAQTHRSIRQISTVFLGHSIYIIRNKADTSKILTS